jgi:hypothetical protein
VRKNEESGWRIEREKERRVERERGKVRALQKKKNAEEECGVLVSLLFEREEDLHEIAQNSRDEK